VPDRLPQHDWRRINACNKPFHGSGSERLDQCAWTRYQCLVCLDEETPTGRGSIRSERTIQTYARSARAFFHWLVRRETIERNPFDRVVFPKVGKPLIRIIEPEEFEQLLLACTPPGEMGRLADRAAARNRAILWLLYDTGIRLAEFCNLRLGDFDRKRFCFAGVISCALSILCLHRPY
jgi:site-specific recombinase XerD